MRAGSANPCGPGSTRSWPVPGPEFDRRRFPPHNRSSGNVLQGGGHGMRIWAKALAAAALVLAALAAGSSARAVTSPSISIGADGETAPVFSYANAIRERVFVPVPGLDQDNDGVTDQMAIDIVRPLETSSGLKVPAIIDP